MVYRITAEQFMALGLELAGYKRWRKYKVKTNIERFRAHFGALPKSCENIWFDLQMSANPECRIDSDADPKHLLLAFNFLWEYPTQKKLFTMFQLTEKTVGKWSKLYTRKIQLLLPSKVSFEMDDI